MVSSFSFLCNITFSLTLASRQYRLGVDEQVFYCVCVIHSDQLKSVSRLGVFQIMLWLSHICSLYELVCIRYLFQTCAPVSTELPQVTSIIQQATVIYFSVQLLHLVLWLSLLYCSQLFVSKDMRICHLKRAMTSLQQYIFQASHMKIPTLKCGHKTSKSLYTAIHTAISASFNFLPVTVFYQSTHVINAVAFAREVLYLKLDYCSHCISS